MKQFEHHNYLQKKEKLHLLDLITDHMRIKI
jgi:hypothetical protein